MIKNISLYKIWYNWYHLQYSFSEVVFAVSRQEQDVQTKSNKRTGNKNEVLTARRSNQSILKETQSWVFFGRTDAKAETPILWPPHAKTWFIGKDSDAGRDWGQEEKGTTEDEMTGWHHWLGGHEFGWTPGVGDGQGGLAWCDSWGRKESDMTERLNWTENYDNTYSI